MVLSGKRSVAYVRHAPPPIKVVINNASKIGLTGRKGTAKYWLKYSGYPGSLRRERVGQVLTKKGHQEMVRRAVYQMLDGNKLRSKLMKNLTITD